MEHEGKIHLYTGDGKGKTTAALGLALRAVGHGMSVYMVQFLKGGNYTGEFVAAENHLPTFKIDQIGKPCIKRTRQKTLSAFSASKRDSPDIMVREAIECGPCRFCFQIDDTDKNNAKKSFFYVESLIKSGDMDLIILDEVTYVINKGFISLETIMRALRNKHPDVEIVLTGRDAPEELIEVADLVSDIRPVKHYMEKGVMARPGIEY
ncbi:MAG: cob(I)yrinic acid a,c-diamide adenosyltransferase [Nanoarchaeota archaeon]